MAAPPLLFRNRGEAKTADQNSHAGWNPGELPIGELPRQRKRRERMGYFGVASP